MDGSIVNFRMGRHTQRPNHIIIQPAGVSTKEAAEKLVGKAVTWTSPAKKELKGIVQATHGVKGAVRAKFERGLPGQALGTKLKIE